MSSVEDPLEPSRAKLDRPEGIEPAGVDGLWKSSSMCVEPSNPGTDRSTSGLGLKTSRLRDSTASESSSSMLALLRLGEMMRLPPLPVTLMVVVSGDAKMSEESTGIPCLGCVVR